MEPIIAGRFSEAAHFLATCQYMCVRFHLSTGWIFHLRSNHLHLRSSTQGRVAGTSWQSPLHVATGPSFKEMCHAWCISHSSSSKSADDGGTVCVGGDRVTETKNLQWFFFPPFSSVLATSSTLELEATCWVEFDSTDPHKLERPVCGKWITLRTFFTTFFFPTLAPYGFQCILNAFFISIFFALCVVWNICK